MGENAKTVFEKRADEWRAAAHDTQRESHDEPTDESRFGVSVQL
jgi:hypothetical protein